ncbi:MAG: hypothetical protein [Caudoviricetes sp.]|nr:MAG: hypothetical protein [Caudoviricetes sp.]
MAKYKIKVIGLLLKNNTMASFGQLVEDNLFNSSAENLEKDGFISKATKSDLDAAKASDSKAKNVYMSKTVEELQAELKTREIAFEEKALKTDLVKLLEADDKK